MPRNSGIGTPYSDSDEVPVLVSQLVWAVRAGRLSMATGAAVMSDRRMGYWSWEENGRLRDSKSYSLEFNIPLSLGNC